MGFEAGVGKRIITCKYYSGVKYSSKLKTCFYRKHYLGLSAARVARGLDADMAEPPPVRIRGKIPSGIIPGIASKIKGL